MIRKVLFMSVGLIASLLISSSYAASETSCKINVAVSTPPLAKNDVVAFNINNNAGVVKSAFLSYEHKYEEISSLPCNAEHPYTISATPFTTQAYAQDGTIGKCTLKAGPLYLAAPESSVAVVFPQDFDCNSSN